MARSCATDGIKWLKTAEQTALHSIIKTRLSPDKRTP
jgi:hypothetical protein